MVDWDRVEELRSKGKDWDEIADDPKVGFHPDSSVHEAGRALRGLYHRQRLRQGQDARLFAIEEDAAPLRPVDRHADVLRQGLRHRGARATQERDQSQ